MAFRKIWRSKSFNVAEKENRYKMPFSDSLDYWERKSTNQQAVNQVTVSQLTNGHQGNGVTRNEVTNGRLGNGVSVTGSKLTNGKPGNEVRCVRNEVMGYQSTNGHAGNEVNGQRSEVKVAGGRINGLAPLSVGNDHKSRLARLKKYLGNVNLTLRPLKINQDKGGIDKSKENKPETKEKKRKAVERGPSFSQKLLRRFSLKRAYSDADIAW